MTRTITRKAHVHYTISIRLSESVHKRIERALAEYPLKFKNKSCLVRLAIMEYLRKRDLLIPAVAPPQDNKESDAIISDTFKI